MVEILAGNTWKELQSISEGLIILRCLIRRGRRNGGGVGIGFSARGQGGSIGEAGGIRWGWKSRTWIQRSRKWRKSPLKVIEMITNRATC